MKESGCCFDNYSNKNKVRLQFTEDNRQSKHPESYGLLFQLTSFSLLTQPPATSQFGLLCWVNVQTEVMGRRNAKSPVDLLKKKI